MNIFELFGRIAIDNSTANNAIEDTAEKSESLKSRMSDAFEKIGGAAVAMGKVVAAGIGVGAAAIGALTKSALDGYADYEQLVGGVETLFGTGGQSYKDYANSINQSTESIKEFQKQHGLVVDGIIGTNTATAMKKSYDQMQAAEKKVLNNAKKAYKTAGLSANEYMETVTGFSASLIASLEGDTLKAADYADMAITDMSDNANKMGSSIESLQNAYSGFAKQNYTMLDNLKLGYGGTKEEMQRLLEDATALSGVKYDIENYADVVDAIHVIQTEMGITGTTAKEASETISGSVAAMKGAWSNLVAGLGNDTADLDMLISDFIDSSVTAIDNIVPRIETILLGIAETVTRLVPIISERLPGLLETLLPPLLEGAVGLFNGLVSALPTLLQILIEQAPFIATSICTALLGTIPQFVEIGKQLFEKIVPDEETRSAISEGFSNALGFIITFWEETLKPCLDSILGFINETLVPKWKEGFEFVKGFVVDNWETIKNTFDSAFQFICDSIDFFTALFQGDWSGMWEALKKAVVDGKNYIVNIFELWKEWFATIGTKIYETLSGHFENIKVAIQEKIEFARDKVNEAVEKIKEFLNLEELKNSVVNKFEEIQKGVKEKIETARDTVDKAIGKIKEFFDLDTLKTNVLGKFDDIKNGIEEKMGWARDKVSEIIEKIKGFFNFKFNLPDIPAPHFSITPSGWKVGDLLQGSIPKLDIRWYKKAMDNPMILNKPSIFGYDAATGNLLGGGEAGSEVVSGADTLMNMIAHAVASQNAGIISVISACFDKLFEILEEYLPEMNRQMVLDTGVLVAETVDMYDEALGQIIRRKER